MWVDHKEIDIDCLQNIFGYQDICKHLIWDIPEPNYTAYALILLVLFLKVSHVTHSFETRKQTSAIVLKPHG